MTLELAWVFGIGLVIGNFVNVLIYRLPRMIMAESTADDTEAKTRFDLSRPASHCPHCKTPLRMWQNIPLLSFVWLKGRCGHCQHPISARYPAIELATALLWTFCAWHWGLNATGLSWSLFASVLLALSVIDWDATLLPDTLTQTLVWLGLMSSAVGWIDLPLTQAVWGAVLGYGSLWLIATLFELITGKQGMGAGDFKLLAGLGAWLGPFALIPVVMLASLSGAVMGLILQQQARLREGGYVPFGPFLATSGVFVAIIGMRAIADYLGWPLFA